MYVEHMNLVFLTLLMVCCISCSQFPKEVVVQITRCHCLATKVMTGGWGYYYCSIVILRNISRFGDVENTLPFSFRWQLQTNITLVNSMSGILAIAFSDALHHLLIKRKLASGVRFRFHTFS